LRNILLILQYDGSQFCGYEIQPEKRTVRGEIEKALHKILKKKIKITSSSRTDSGVHAVSNTINFKTQSRIPISSVPKALNSVLPQDLRVVKAEEVRPEFNARFDVKSKEYEYLIYNGKILNPLFKGFVWHLKQKLDLNKMRRVYKTLTGRRDFSTYCAAGSSAKDFVCTIRSITILRKKLKLWDNCELPVISIKFKGDRFLYKMVRNMVGKIASANKCAPPQGLCLISVKL